MTPYRKRLLERRQIEFLTQTTKQSSVVISTEVRAILSCAIYIVDGYCPFGIRCSFAHGDFEIRSKYDPIYPPIDCYPAVPMHLFHRYCDSFDLSLLDPSYNFCMNLQSQQYQSSIMTAYSNSGMNMNNENKIMIIEDNESE